MGEVASVIAGAGLFLVDEAWVNTNYSLNELHGIMHPSHYIMYTKST